MSKGRTDKGAIRPEGARGEPTVELEPRAASDADEFDGPTQLVDAGAYAATLAKATRSDEARGEERTVISPSAGAPLAERPVDDETHISPPPRAGQPQREPTAAARADAVPSPRKTGGGLFPDADDMQLPQRLGQYMLLEQIGLGGMAEVFLAQQDGPSGFRRKLVIKRIHPHLSSDDRFVQMFLREARVAAGLQHRNIVRIDELGSDQGIYFIAMEYVDGVTLQRLARRAWRNGLSLPMELAISAAADAASALHYAHSYVDPDGTERRIVHRDVSPDNLIVDRAGNTKLLDFGVAKAAGSISVTRAGEVKGKVPYMAPEQLHGRPLDGRADLYSLGATLYWLLTGKRPFRGETDLEVMQAIAYDEPVPPRQLNPEVPEVIERIILRLLSKSPDDRHANGQELADELGALLLPSRREVAAFVEEASSLTSDDDGEPASSSSFIAATPRTAHFISESRRVLLERFLPPANTQPAPSEEPTVALPAEGMSIADLIDAEIAQADSSVHDDVAAPSAHALSADSLSASALSPEVSAVEPPDELRLAGGKRSLPMMAAAAGVGAAVLLAVVGWMLSGDEDAEALPAPPPHQASAAPSDGTAPRTTDDEGTWSFHGEAATVDDEPAADAPAEPSPGDREAEPPEVAAASEPAVDDEPVAATEPARPASPQPTSSKRDARAQESAASSASRARPTVKLQASGPGPVVWKLGKRTLGSGTATLEVPEGTTSVTAYHKGRRVQTRVPVRSGKVDYANAPKGTLDIRVLPYATIYAGNERLWKVPGPPREVPAGKYKLRIEYEGKSKTETVTVEAGATAKVRVNMME